MAPYRAEDLVFVRSNFCLLSRNFPQYHQEKTKMWDIARDEFGSIDENEILEVVCFNDDNQKGRGRT